MEFLTVAKMAQLLGIKKNAVYQRLHNAKIKPVCKDAIYSQADFETIKLMSKVGRPRKKSPAES
jgi:hypothetical protein